jgi:photosystem II stability/assembly factor-like uncharacterized protein
LDAVAPTAVVAEFSSADRANAEITTTGAAGRGGGGGRGGRGGGAATATRPEQVFRQAVPVRWRVLASGAVVRSTDEGATWTAVAIDPPAHVLGGAAPSVSVCWLIARQGVILRSIDGGATFVPFISPELTELASIRATSAQDASVTTVTGRVYITTDGGVTWRLQGFQPAPF